MSSSNFEKFIEYHKRFKDLLGKTREFQHNGYQLTLTTDNVIKLNKGQDWEDGYNSIVLDLTKGSIEISQRDICRGSDSEVDGYDCNGDWIDFAWDNTERITITAEKTTNSRIEHMKERDPRDYLYAHEVAHMKNNALATCGAIAVEMESRQQHKQQLHACFRELGIFKEEKQAVSNKTVQTAVPCQVSAPILG